MKNVMRKRFAVVGIAGLLLSSSAVFGSDEADGGTGSVDRWNFPKVGSDSTSTIGSSASVGRGLVVLVPATAANPIPANGCWVQVFEHDNYDGDSVLVAGPRSLSNMQSAGGHPFNALGDSVVAGPNAKATLYEDENFGGKALNVTSNQHISQVRESFGPFESVGSLSIACTG